MLTNDQIKILGILSQKYKLGLEVSGNKVYRAGQMQNLWQVEEYYNTYFPKARDEFITNLFLKTFEDISDKPAEGDIPAE